MRREAKLGDGVGAVAAGVEETEKEAPEKKEPETKAPGKKAPGKKASGKKEPEKKEHGEKDQGQRDQGKAIGNNGNARMLKPELHCLRVRCRKTWRTQQTTICWQRWIMKKSSTRTKKETTCS